MRNLIAILIYIFPTWLVAQSAERSYDSQKAPIKTLDGYWFFSCEDPPSTHQIAVPGTWRGYECPQGKLPGTGRHQYRLILTGEVRPEGLALYLPVAGTSMAVYWNGKKIHAAGDVEKGKPGFQPEIIDIPFLERNELIIDVSNFDDRYGGLWQAPQIGNSDRLRYFYKYRFIQDGVLTGLLFFCALYTLSLYIGLRKQQYLFLGFFALAISLRNLLEGQRILHILFGAEHWYLLIRLTHLCFYGGFIFFFAYLKKFFADKIWPWRQLTLIAILGLYSLLVIFTPPVFFTEFLNIAMFTVTLLGVELLILTFKAVRKKVLYAKTLAVSFAILFVAGLHDIVFHSAFGQTIELIPASLVLFMFINLIILQLTDSRLQKISQALAKQSQERLTSFERLLPSLVKRFQQISSDITAMFTSRETIPLQFTTLFADLRGFTTIAESRPPEEVFALINQYLDTVVPPIMAHGGEVLDYQGDGILAYFTAGAETCLKAAIEMQQALQQAYEKGLLPKLEMGIAMESGSGLLTLLGNYQRLEPVIVSPAILEVQDLEMLCSEYKVTNVFPFSFCQQLPEYIQKQVQIITFVENSPIFTFTGSFTA